MYVIPQSFYLQAYKLLLVLEMFLEYSSNIFSTNVRNELRNNQKYIGTFWCPSELLIEVLVYVCTRAGGEGGGGAGRKRKGF